MIAIRAATRADADAIAAIYAPYVTDGAVSFEAVPPDAEAMRARMAAAGAPYPWLVATDGDGLLGYAAAARFRERDAYRFVVETSIYLARDACGRGIGRLLYGALIDALCAQGFTQAIAAVVPPNAASARLHEALGFRRAGCYRAVGWKHGAWHDVELWQRALANPADPPAEPRPFSKVGTASG